MKATSSQQKLSQIKWGWVDWAWLLIVSVIGLAPRILVLERTNYGIESDEAIVGLMGKHILEGLAYPIFYYGQDYLGSLEAFAAAGSFYLFGVSNFALKLVPLSFCLVFIGVTYLLALKLSNRFAACLSSLYLALAPSGFMLWGLKARGGFIELLVIGSLCLLQALRLSEGIKARDVFVLGLLLGFGWWVNNQIIFYAATVAIWLFSWDWKRSGLSSALLNALNAFCGFILGGGLFWYANLVSEPKFSSLRTLFGGTLRSVKGESEGGGLLSTTIEHLGGFFELSLPILFGARRFWTEQDLYPGSSILAYAAYGFCYLSLIFIAFRQRSGHLLLLVIFPPIVALIFSLSSFGWLSQAPRYLLPLYSVLPLIVGISLSAFPRWLGMALFGVFLSMNLASNYYGKLALPGQPVVYAGGRVAEDHSELYAWLESQNYRYVYANYWIGYRIAFETAERIRFARYRGPQSLRIPLYERVSLVELEENPVYVLVAEEANLTTRGLAELGYRFRQTVVGGYVVIDEVRPVSVFGEPLAPEKASASILAENASSAIDGDLSTRWSSGGTPQRDGMAFTLSFASDAPRIAGLSLDLGFWPHDRPQELQILGLEPDGSWCELFDSREVDIEVDFGRQWKFYFEPRNFIALKLIQRGNHSVFDWSIAELEVYREGVR